MPSDNPFHQPTAQFENDEYWDEYAEANGQEATEAHRKQMRASPAAYGEMAIERYKIKQEDKRVLRQEEREEETLRLAREANKIARDTRTEMRWTWGVGAVVAIVVALFF